jgi:hypothetical protein
MMATFSPTTTSNRSLRSTNLIPHYLSSMHFKNLTWLHFEWSKQTCETDRHGFQFRAHLLSHCCTKLAFVPMGRWCDHQRWLIAIDTKNLTFFWGGGSNSKKNEDQRPSLLTPRNHETEDRGCMNVICLRF